MKPIARSAMLVATLMVLSGCAGKQDLMTTNDRFSLSSYPHFIAIHHTPRETFRLTYSGGGILAAVQAGYEAERLKRDLRLEDPAPYFKDRLVNALQANFKLTNVRPVAEYPQNINIALETHSETIRKRLPFASWAAWNREATPCAPSPGVVCLPEDEDRLSRLRLDSTLKETFPNGVVLEVQTSRWMLESTPRVVYSAGARLLRLADSAVIWQRTCGHVAEALYSIEDLTLLRQRKATALAERRMANPTIIDPTASELMMEEIEANDGKLLKAKLREAAEGCADRLLPAFGIVSQPNR